MRGQKPVEDVWKEWNDLLLHFCIGMQLPKFPKLRDRLGALFAKLLLLGVKNF